MRENGRNDRPTNTVDAQPCLSDVYKNSTRAKRRQADAVLSGRSMVEMLGVLAIIGVLSVGAIAGYSKAMFKYKLNKQAESFNMLLNNAIQIKPQLERAFTSTSIRFGADLFDKLNLIPDGMRVEGSTIYDVFHNSIGISYYYNNQTGNIDYVLHWTMDRANNKTTQRASEICRNMILVAKENAANLPVLSVRTGQTDGTYDATALNGDERCTNNRNCLRNATLQQINDMCSACESETYCQLIIYFMIKKYQ